LWVDELCGINKFTAAIALVALSIIVMTHWALSSNKPVCKEALALFAVLLINNFFKCFLLLIDIIENILSDDGLLWSTGATKSIEVTIKPFINLRVDFIVFITNFLA